MTEPRQSPESAAPDMVGAIEAALSSSRGEVSFLAGQEIKRVAWPKIWEDTRRVASVLNAREIGPGSRVAVFAGPSFDMVSTLLACWVVGATVSIVAPPVRVQSVPAAIGQLRPRLQAIEPSLVIFDEGMDASVPEWWSSSASMSLQEIARSKTRRLFDSTLMGDDRTAIIQFTSGSTSDPRGVQISQWNICSNIAAIVADARLSADDRFVSWLPMYHDMGLIGFFLTPAFLGCDLVLAAPQQFLSRPANWFEWLSQFRGTITGAPNFAYALAARHMRNVGGLDLSSVRLMFNGAEPIDPDVVDDLLSAAAPAGLQQAAAYCVFGMAEATLAVTFPEPGSGMTTDVVNASSLNVGESVVPAADTNSARRLPVLGKPVSGMSVRVCDPISGHALEDRRVGEIEIAGPSVTGGYFGRPDATAASFHHGWLRSGDLGYLTDGELVVCGRAKDVVIIRGRNIWPQDAERAASSIDGVRPGNVVAFGIPDRAGEGLVVVAEVRHDADARAVQRGIADVVHACLEVAPRVVVTVPPGTVPKTSSGKLRRSSCREAYLAGQLHEVQSGKAESLGAGAPL